MVSKVNSLKASRKISYGLYFILYEVIIFSFACKADIIQFGWNSPLSFSFDKKYGQVEVGGPFVGVEFHGSRPLPSRISFYSPVANSIDVSKDYWKRGESMPMALGIAVGNQRRWLGKDPWRYVLSPHKVVFFDHDSTMSYRVSYEFCKSAPAMVFMFQAINTSQRRLPIEVYTHLLLALRTCQTYARKDSSFLSYDSTHQCLAARFDDPQCDRAVVFVENRGEIPNEWASSVSALGIEDTGISRWISSSTVFGEPQSRSTGIGEHVAAFLFKKDMGPNDTLTVTEIIGSCSGDELQRFSSYSFEQWNSEIDAYDRYVRTKALDQSHFITGDSSLDNTAVWARAILATNAHFIDGHIVPMPCPAEYNFFFTHDVLLTDLAAVNFDLARVKGDLNYIISHAKNHVIPHAYYWRDDGFKTEYCAPDNWNHLWFILVCASYFRHSQDSVMAAKLYPFVKKSLDLLLTRRKADGLMYAEHPDWWDIGNREGPRAYLTILAIRAINEFLFFSARLGKFSASLPHLETVANQMKKQLSESLWDPKAGYLMNFNNGDYDGHYYAGSLLAAVYQELDAKRIRMLVATAEKEIVDSSIGVRTVSPMDFQTDSLIRYFKFAGKEAGDPYVYINGGVWPQTTAWYILALHSIGENRKALDYFKKTYTLDGVAQSPMGQPAMFEYRFSDPASPEFGKIDKPSFLWSGGFFLQVLYRLCGTDENEWNLSFSPTGEATSVPRLFSFAFGNQKDISLSETGEYLSSFQEGNNSIHSLVIPLDASNTTPWNIQFGKSRFPYLEQLNAILHSVSFDTLRGTMSLSLSSFSGHTVVFTIVAPRDYDRIELPDGIILDSKTFHRSKVDHTVSVENIETISSKMLRWKFSVPGTDTVQSISFTFIKEQ
jgi:Amylo-alpha-1,6-glucosidase